MATTARSSRSGAVTAAERALVAIRTPSLEAMASGLLLAGAILFNLYTLLPEVTIPAPKLNDGVLHLLALGRAVAALAAGQDPTDPWLPSIALGYPLFHYYQHFAYVVPAGLYFAVVVLLHRLDPLVDAASRVRPTAGRAGRASGLAARHERPVRLRRRQLRLARVRDVHPVVGNGAATAHRRPGLCHAP